MSSRMHVIIHQFRLGLVVKAEEFITLGLNNKDDLTAWGQSKSISGQLMAGQKFYMESKQIIHNYLF